VPPHCFAPLKSVCNLQILRAEKVESGEWEPKLAGCRGTSLLVKHLDYVDYCRVHICPVAHALLLGAVKDFWNLGLSATPRGTKRAPYVISSAMRKAMAARWKFIILTCDFGRPYRCVINQRGYWVMEDWTNWIEVYSVYITQPVQKVFMTGYTIFTNCLPT
jgi:hypothetical protein